MRNLLRWLMILGALAGMSLRASGAGVCHQVLSVACPADGTEEVVCCEQDHHDPAPGTSDHSEDSGSPHGSDHHHHHVCCGMSSLAVDDLQACRLPLPACLLIGMQWSDLGIPESPVFDLDKPPLI